MLITITDASHVDGQMLARWGRAGHALCLDKKVILSVTDKGYHAAVSTRGGPGGRSKPVAREPTLDELKAWFKWQKQHGRTNQRFVEGGLPWPADD